MTLNGGALLLTKENPDLTQIDLETLFEPSKINSGGYGIIDVSWRSPQEVWAVGGSGIIFQSKDGGKTFKFIDDAKDILSSYQSGIVFRLGHFIGVVHDTFGDDLELRINTDLEAFKSKYNAKDMPTLIRKQDVFSVSIVLLYISLNIAKKHVVLARSLYRCAVDGKILCFDPYSRATPMEAQVILSEFCNTLNYRSY
jgi:hypothetical protein